MLVGNIKLKELGVYLCVSLMLLSLLDVNYPQCVCAVLSTCRILTHPSTCVFFPLLCAHSVVEAWVSDWSSHVFKYKLL